MLIDRASGALVPYALSDQGRGEAFRADDMAYVRDAKVRLGDGVTGWVAKHGMSVVIDDVRTDPRYRALRDNIRSELCVPLRLDEGIIGIVNVESVEVGKYGLADLRVLETIAAQIAIAIENSRLLAEARRSSRERHVAELAGGVAHDIGNLFALATIEASVIASEDASPEARRASAGRILEASALGIKLTSRILRTGHENPVDPKTQAIASLTDVLSELRDVLNAIGRGSIRITLDLPDENLMVPLSAAALDQIVLNLVVNACQAMDYRGDIRLRAGISSVGGDGQPRAVFEVADTGCGMSEETRRNAFEPYFTTRASGTGLGLSTVNRLVRSAGGSASIRSAPDAGTTVVIQLPLMPD